MCACYSPFWQRKKQKQKKDTRTPKKYTTPRMTSNMNALGYPKLQAQTPVPSDIEISQSIVNNVGLLPLPDLAKQ